MQVKTKPYFIGLIITFVIALIIGIIFKKIFNDTFLIFMGFVWLWNGISVFINKSIYCNYSNKKLNLVGGISLFLLGIVWIYLSTVANASKNFLPVYSLLPFVVIFVILKIVDTKNKAKQQG